MGGVSFYFYPSEPEKIRSLGPWSTDKYADWTTFACRGNTAIGAIRIYQRRLVTDGIILRAVGFGRIWVEPGERGKGVGRDLHKFTCNEMRGRGFAVAIGVARRDHFLHKGCRWKILNEKELKKDQYLVGKELIGSIDLGTAEWRFDPEDLF